MVRSEHERWQKQIEQLFLGKLSGPPVDELRAHIRGCPPCEKVYDQFARAENAAFGRATGLSPFAAERISGSILAQSVKRTWFERHSRGLVLAFGAAVAALVLAILPIYGSRPQDEFQARGGATTAATEVSLRALRVRATAAGAPSVADLASAGELTRGDQLRLLATNLGTGVRRVSVGALTADGVQRPLVAEQDLAGGQEDLPLGSVLSIPADWPVGKLVITAVFRGTDGKGEETRSVEAVLGEAP